MNQLRNEIANSVHLVSKRFFVLVFGLLVCAVPTMAQVTRSIQKANTLYGQRKYKEAAADYAKVVQKNPNYTPGLFNLGNSLYQQKQFDSSRMVMERTAKVAKDKGSKAAANYNIGNTYMSQQKWEEAVEAYKNTLRNNPQDADAKYNLSYAKQMLKKEQQQNKDNKDKKKDDKNKDKKDKKDQQQKDKDKKDDKDKQDKKDQQDKDKNKDKKEEEKRPQGQPSKLSKQRAEQILNALQQEEKKLQEKMKKEKGVPVKMEKDW